MPLSMSLLSCLSWLWLSWAAAVLAHRNCSSESILDPVIHGFPITVSPKKCFPDHRCGPPIMIPSSYDTSGLRDRNASDYNGILAESIYYTLPAIISLYRPDLDETTVQNLAGDYAVGLAEAAVDAMRHLTDITAADINDPAPTRSDLAVSLRDRVERRDIFGDIGGFFAGIGEGIAQGAEDIFCAAFAVSTNPAFSAAAGVFHLDNNGAIGMTDAQLFFVRAAMGSNIPAGISITYNAFFPFFFPGGTVGITFDTSIYTKLGPHVNPTRYDTNDLFFVDPDFSATTAIVVHETQHVLQYAGYGWNLWNFGYQYLYDYCEAGFSYTGNALEQQAYTTQYSVYPLLMDQPFTAFFNVWGAFHLRPQLGFPTTVTPIQLTWLDEPSEALRFDAGLLEIRTRSKCYRAWSGKDWATLYASECQIVPIPPHAGKGCPPACGKGVNAGAISAHNAACLRARKKGLALRNSKPWVCWQA